MSANRTPPKELSGSAPNLSITQLSVDDNFSPSNITFRHEKRKRGDVLEEELKSFMVEMKDLMRTATDEQNRKLSLLQSSIEEIKNQNNEITKSVEFLSAKYDEIKSKLEESEKEKTNNLAYINSLENRIEQLERVTRHTSIEIRNAPKNKVEKKEDLITMVKNIGSAINAGIADSDIKDVYRYNSKTSAKMPIVVEFTTVTKKEAVLKSAKKFRQDPSVKLTTTHAKIDGPAEPLYISESLTAPNKKIFALARKFATENNYKFCWSSQGIVYLRKEEGAKAIRLQNEEDLKGLVPAK